MKPKKRALSRLLGVTALGASALAVGGTAATTLFTQSAGAVGCTAAGSTGLTAALVVTSGTISAQAVDATGCDIGIYVGPTASGVTIGGTTTAAAVSVSGANDTGIFVDQASNVTIENDGGGGIFVNDNGPVNPGAPDPGPNAPVASTDDTVSNNTISGNYGSCGIVYATHNSGGSITGGVITGNTITGHIGVFNLDTLAQEGDIPGTSAHGGAVDTATCHGQQHAGERQHHQRLVRGRHHRARPRSQ